MYAEFILYYILFAVLCYFISNFNFAILLSKRVKRVDIRTQGSGNPGTTNMFRVFGARLGLPTFILDAMKGVICAGAGLLIFSSAGVEAARLAAYIGGVSAGLGHIFPVFYKFNGGKGVACGIGFFLVVNPVYTVIAISVCAILLIVSDRMSLFSLVLFTSIMVYSVITEPYILFIFAIVYWLIVFIAHRENIKRLVARKEKPLGLRKKLFGNKKS